MAYGVNAPFGLRPISSINGGSWTEKTNEYFIHASTDGTTTYASSIFTGDPVVFNPALANVGTISVYLPDFTDAAPSTFSDLPILGVFQGCEYTDATGKLVQSPYWPASTIVQAGTKIKAFVLDDPNTIFDIQISTSKDANLNAFVSRPYLPVTNSTPANVGSFGSNFALNIGGGTNFNTITKNGGAFDPKTNPYLGYKNNPASGDARTGQSAFYLDASTSNVLNNDHDYVKTTETLPLKAIGYTLDPKNTANSKLTLETTPFLNVRVMINNHYYKAGTVGTTLA